MKQTYEELQLQLAAVVAENATLKRFPDQIIGFIGKLGTSEIGADTKEKIELAACRVKTPETDAYLAEIRAQGVELYLKEMDNNGMATPAEFAAQLRQGAKS